MTQLKQDGKVVQYRYNSAGEMLAMQYGAMGNVRTTGYDYDEMGRLKAVKSSIMPAAADGAPMDTSNLKTVKSYHHLTNGDLEKTIEYLQFDTMATDKTGLNLETTYQYDALGRAISQTVTQNGVEKEKTMLAFGAEDARGYVTGETYIDKYLDSYTNNAEQTTTRGYTYDAIGRLTQNTVVKGTQSKTIGYTYDEVGNRLTESKNETLADGTTMTTNNTYAYNNLHQLTQKKQSGTITLIGGASQTHTDQVMANYSYDDYGNQVGMEKYAINAQTLTSEKKSEIRNTYDSANQLMKVEEQAAGAPADQWTKLNESLYNGEGQRVRKTEGTNTNGDHTKYFYMGGALAFSTNSDQNYLTGENILSPSGQIVAGKRADNVYNVSKPEGQYWIYHYDTRGSVTNIVGTDAQGNLFRAENNVYDAFGKEDSGRPSSSSIKNEVKYTGAVQDNSGMVYLSARHYDPNTGRFLQQDTVKGDAFSPWTQNLYAYTTNNPVNYIDPTGHRPDYYEQERDEKRVEKRKLVMAARQASTKRALQENDATKEYDDKALNELAMRLVEAAEMTLYRKVEVVVGIGENGNVSGLNPSIYYDRDNDLPPVFAHREC